MRTILFLIQKEFIQIVRNRTMLPLIFVMPIVQLLILVFAADLNMKSIEYSAMDMDGSSTSRELLSHYDNSPFFIHRKQLFSEEEINHSLKSGETDIVLVIPAGFESALTRNEPVEVQFLVDGINTTAAVLTAVYAQNILMEFHNNLGGAWVDQQSSKNIGIHIRSHHWYNKELDFKIYMVPGILVLLVSMIGWILAALNIVREKEIGTIEQINVTPVRKYQFII
ncbi:MAG: ABC transporter permease, partial [Bacteroidales bacterium]|nr:ABC transporter permease [Bacteroidales bacterium]